MAPRDRWSVRDELPEGMGSSVFVGPLALPGAARKRRWVWLLLWTLLVFAGGVAAGPTVTTQAIGLVKGACSMLGMTPPQWVERLQPAAPTPALPLIAPSPALGVEEGAGTPTAPGGPAVERAAAQADKPAGEVAPQPAARAATAATQGRAQAAAAAMPAARSPHAKSGAKALSARAASERTASGTPAAAPAVAAYHDPFVDSAESASQPEPAAPSRKPKESFEDFAPAAKTEPAPKATASPSRDSLDSLMADVVTDNKGKGKPRAGKGLDAILNDVQKGKPETPPRREAQAPLPPLSQADISRVMAGVKMRSKDCARKFDQDGIAELSLIVGKDGSVTDVKLGGKLANTLVGGCIEKAARAAAFPRSAGLRFDYRIDVR